MAIYFTDPAFPRAGVVAGFVLEAPLAGTPAASNPVFQFYNWNITVPGYPSGAPNQNLVIGAGYQHWITIGPNTYGYVQQETSLPPHNTDSVATIVTQLAAAINGAPDPYAVATASTGAGTVTLAPRLDTDEAIQCSASDGNEPPYQTLVELTGNNLIPSCSPGVLFANGQMYRPAGTITLPAAPANQQSWLFYSSVNGFYWQNSNTPLAPDDAFIGWVVTNSMQVVAFSSRRIGVGAEAIIKQTGPPAIILGEQGDTGLPPAPVIGFSVQGNGQLTIGEIGLTKDNTEGVVSATFILYYIDETVGPVATLTANLSNSATSLSASTALPAASPTQPSFLFFAETQSGGPTIGPGYVHNIVIGSNTYSYTQLTADTDDTVAEALAILINSLEDPNATATASGNTVTLVPLLNNGNTVTCSASDGNTPQTLHETQPTFVLVEPGTGGGAGEIIQVKATDGSSITRAQLGATASAFSSGALIWQIQTMTQLFALPGPALGSDGWPAPLAVIPFRAKGLVAADAWVTNEFGDSPVATNNYSSGLAGGRLRALSGWTFQLSVSGTLAIGGNQCPPLTLSQIASVYQMWATVGQVPVGAPVTVVLRVAGLMWATITIPTTASANTPAGTITINTTPSVDGLIIPASTPVTLDITSVGTTTPGANLVVTVQM